LLVYTLATRTEHPQKLDQRDRVEAVINAYETSLVALRPTRATAA
jgi:hypothetical protein